MSTNGALHPLVILGFPCGGFLSTPGLRFITGKFKAVIPSGDEELFVPSFRTGSPSFKIFLVVLRMALDASELTAVSAGVHRSEELGKSVRRDDRKAQGMSVE